MRTAESPVPARSGDALRARSRSSSGRRLSQSSTPAATQSAAELLHKSQSTITYAVQKLESLLGVKAFELRGRKAVLTPTGEPAASGVRASCSTRRAEWSGPRGPFPRDGKPEIGIAADILFPYWLLLQCFERFGSESPHTRIELIESVLAGTTEALLDGTRGSRDQRRPSRKATRRMRWSVCAMIPVANPNHPLHRLGRPLTSRDLRAHRQLVVRESRSAGARRRRRSRHRNAGR